MYSKYFLSFLFLFLFSLSFLFSFTTGGVSYCKNPPSATSPPIDEPNPDSYPSIPPLDSLNTLKINSGCSERTANSYTQPFFNSSTFTWPRLACPHLQSNLIALENTNYFNATDPAKILLIPSGSKILLRPCSVPPNFEFIRILIQSNASLVFDDAPISLFVREIIVETGGSLLIGSESCRLYSSINITFPGRKNESSLVDFSGNPSKGILSRGRLEIHGRLFQPTWTRLARTSAA